MFSNQRIQTCQLLRYKQCWDALPSLPQLPLFLFLLFNSPWPSWFPSFANWAFNHPLDTFFCRSWTRMIRCSIFTTWENCIHILKHKPASPAPVDKTLSCSFPYLRMGLAMAQQKVCSLGTSFYPQSRWCGHPKWRREMIANHALLEAKCCSSN